MTGVLYQFPPQARFGRAVPKTRIHTHAGMRRNAQRLLSFEVDRIVWAYKLAPNTINLPARDGVAEIQVFSIELKRGVKDISESLLRAIDQAIPSPILFEVQDEERIRCVAAYKRPNETGASRIVLSDYLWSDWLPQDSPRQPLPVALDLPNLYSDLLRGLIPLTPRAGESLSDQLARLTAVRAAERSHSRLEAQLRRETQFNRKVDINRRLRDYRARLTDLQRNGDTQPGDWTPSK